MIIKYKQYPYYKDDELVGFSDEKWSKLKEDFDLIEEQNKDIRKPYSEKLVEIRKLTKELFGEKSNEYKYVQNKMSTGTLPINRWFDHDRKRRQLLDKMMKDKKEKETEEKILKYQQECVRYLLDQGYLLGEDFNLDNAITTAEEKVYDNEVQKYKDADKFINFNGDDNCEDCRGWNPNDHRCDCGNRRVSFTSGYEFTIHDPHIYAEAY